MIENVGFHRTRHQASEAGFALVVPAREIKGARGPVSGVGEIQIQVAVVVVVKENRGLRVSDVAHARFRGNVLEGAVPTVVKEHVASACAGHEEVGPTVVVVIGERRADGNPVAQADPGLRCHVLEGAVPAIAVEGVRAVLVEEVDVVATIVVVVADRQARAVVIQIDAESLSLFSRQEVHPKRDASLLSALLKPRPSTGPSTLVPAEE